MRTVLHLVWTPWGRCPKQEHREGVFSFIITITVMLFGTKKDIDMTMHSVTPGGGQWSPLPGFLTDLSWEWTLRYGCITPHTDSCYNNAERCSSSLKWGETPAIKVASSLDHRHYWKTDGVLNMRLGFPVAGKIKRSLHAQQIHSLVYTLRQNYLRDEAVTITGRYVNAKEVRTGASNI